MTAIQARRSTRPPRRNRLGAEGLKDRAGRAVALIVDASDLEGLAIALYERLGHDPSRPVSTFRLARDLLGADALIRPPSIVGSPASTFTLGGARRIALKRTVPLRYARFFVGHELGHALLEEEGYAYDDLEVCCDYLGAALMAPRPAMRAMQGIFGFAFDELAEVVGATQTWAALRCAEVLRMPLAVIAPTVRVRGPEEWVWPDEQTLREWARSRRAPRGLARLRLTDDPHRVVLRPEDADP